MVSQADVRVLDGLIRELERWAMRREKLLPELDGRAAKRLRTMVRQLATARASLLAGGLLAKAGLRDLVERAEELLDEQADSTRVRPSGLDDVEREDSGTRSLQALLQLEEPAPSSLRDTRPTFEPGAPRRPAPIRREESTMPPPVVRVPDAEHPATRLARVSLAKRPSPRPGGWTTQPSALPDLDFTGELPPRTDDD